MRTSRDVEGTIKNVVGVKVVINGGLEPGELLEVVDVDTSATT